MFCKKFLNFFVLKLIRIRKKQLDSQIQVLANSVIYAHILRQRAFHVNLSVAN
jgi:hypothetical protein